MVSGMILTGMIDTYIYDPYWDDPHLYNYGWDQTGELFALHGFRMLCLTHTHLHVGANACHCSGLQASRLRLAFSSTHIASYS